MGVMKKRYTERGMKPCRLRPDREPIREGTAATVRGSCCDCGRSGVYALPLASMFLKCESCGGTVKVDFSKRGQRTLFDARTFA